MGRQTCRCSESTRHRTDQQVPGTAPPPPDAPELPTWGTHDTLGSREATQYSLGTCYTPGKAARCSWPQPFTESAIWVNSWELKV